MRQGVRQGVLQGVLCCAPKAARGRRRRGAGAESRRRDGAAARSRLAVLPPSGRCPGVVLLSGTDGSGDPSAPLLATTPLLAATAGATSFPFKKAEREKYDLNMV